jgi:zinc protease
MSFFTIAVRWTAKVLFGLILIPGLNAQTPSTQQFSEPVWTDRIIHGQLTNGLRYFVYDSDKSTDPFNIRLIVNAGAIDENNHRGIAHAVEHMVFHETAQHPETIHQYLSKLGWKTGLQINARTGMAETQYMLRTRPDDALNIRQSVALLAQLALHAQIREASWQQERNVIIEEMRQGDSVAKRLNEQKKAIVRHGSRYADRTTIGTVSDLMQAKATDLAEFYHRYYRPANMVIIAAGNVDAPAFKQALNDYFSPQHPQQALARPYLNLPLQPQLIAQPIQEPHGVTSRVAFGLRSAQQPRDSLAGKREALENYFLRNLFKAEVRRRADRLPNGISNWSMTLDEPTPERLTLAFATTTDNYQSGLNFILTELERLYRHGLDAREFTQIKQKALRSLDDHADAVAKRDFAAWEDKITDAVLQHSVIENEDDYVQRTRAWIARLQLSDINRRLQSLLTSQDRFAYFQLPGHRSVQLPDAQAIDATEAKLRRSDLPDLPPATPTIAPPQIQASKRVMPMALPEPSGMGTGTLRTKKTVGTLPVITWQLSNGDKVLWLNRPTTDGKLYIRAISKAGYLNRRYPGFYSQTAVQLWQQSGFDFWKANDNDAYLSSATPHWTWVLQAEQLDLGAAVPPEGLPALLREYANYHVAGQIRPDVLAAVQPDLINTLTHEPSRQEQAWQLLRTGQQATEDQTLPKLDQLTRIARAHLAAPVTYYLVGQIDESRLHQQIQTYLTPIPRTHPLPGKPDLQQPGVHLKRLPFYDQDKATVRIQAYTVMTWRPEQAFLISTLTPLVQTALKEELRLKRSGVYSVTFDMHLDADSNRVIAELNFSCAPERADELRQAALAVLDKFPYQLEHLNMPRIQADIAYAEQLRMHDNNTWLRRMILSECAYGDQRYLEHNQQLVNRVTQSALRKAALSIFPFSNHISLITLPKPATTPE